MNSTKRQHHNEQRLRYINTKLVNRYKNDETGEHINKTVTLDTNIILNAVVNVSSNLENVYGLRTINSNSSMKEVGEAIDCLNQANQNLVSSLNHILHALDEALVDSKVR